MKLKSIILENFRAYKDRTEIQLDNLTVLIGKNDAGKSSVLDALDIFFNKSAPDADDVCVYPSPRQAGTRTTRYATTAAASSSADQPLCRDTSGWPTPPPCREKPGRAPGLKKTAPPGNAQVREAVPAPARFALAASGRSSAASVTAALASRNIRIASTAGSGRNICSPMAMPENGSPSTAQARDAIKTVAVWLATSLSAPAGRWKCRPMPRSNCSDSGTDHANPAGAAALARPSTAALVPGEGSVRVKYGCRADSGCGVVFPLFEGGPRGI
jgi:hypothetical protein